MLRADVERAMHPGTNRADRMVALEEALQETARMSDLVDSLLTLARADEGRFDIHRTPIELEPLVREVYETAVILGEDAGLTLSLSALENARRDGRPHAAPPAAPQSRHERDQVHAARWPAWSSRRPAELNDEIAIAVRDTGIGISANDLPHVFDRFWRADRARSRQSERESPFPEKSNRCDQLEWQQTAHGVSGLTRCPVNTPEFAGTTKAPSPIPLRISTWELPRNPVRIGTLYARPCRIPITHG